MAPKLSQRDHVVVAHRIYFWGRPTSGNQVSWEYEGQQPWTLRSEARDRAISALIHR
jgi:hypothetical protein